MLRIGFAFDWRLDRAMDLRERILDAAVTLIEAEGLAALSMREVARRAGVSHQAPYHHFTDRQAILAAIAEEGFKRLNAGLAWAAGKSGLDAATRLAEAGRAYVEFAASNPAYFRVMFRPELVSLDNYPSARAESCRAFTALEALVKDAVKDKVIGPSLADGTVLVAWAFVQGLSWLLIEGPLANMAAEGLTADDQVKSALQAYKSLLAGRKKAKPGR